MRRLQRVEKLLPTVDVLAGTGELVLVDQRVLPLALHMRHAVRRTEDEVAVPDLVVVPVERANRRAGNAIALGVVLPAVAGAAVTARGNGRDQRDPLTALALDVLLLVVLHRSVRLDGTAEVRAAIRDDREARLTVQETVVADVRRAMRDLPGLRMHEELRHEPLPLGEVVQRSEVDVRVPLLDVRRHDHEPDCGYGHEPADHAAEPERCALEEAVSGESMGLRHRRLAVGWGYLGGRRNLAPLRLDRLGRAAILHRRLARPQESEHDRDRRADRRHDDRIHDQPDEDAGNAGREADRVDRGARKMRPVPVPGLRHRTSPLWVTTSGFNPRLVRRVNDVTNGATGRNSD